MGQRCSSLYTLRLITLRFLAVHVTSDPLSSVSCSLSRTIFVLHPVHQEFYFWWQGRYCFFQLIFVTPCTSQLASNTGKPKMYIVVIRNKVTTWCIVIAFPDSTRCSIHRYDLCSWGAVVKRTRGKSQPTWLFYKFGSRGNVTRSSRAVFLTSIAASAKAGENTGVSWPRRRDCTGGSHLAWHTHCVLSEPNTFLWPWKKLLS